MKSLYRSIIPLLLRPAEVLTDDEVIRIKTIYAKIGQKQFDEFLKIEKQNRAFASLVLSEIDCDASYWKQVHDEYTKRNTAILKLVQDASEEFVRLGGKTLCVYENFGALLSSGISLGCFASGDVDFTMNKSELDKAEAAFGKVGFIHSQRDGRPQDLEHIRFTYHNKVALDGQGYWFNIMWKPISRRYFLVQSKYAKRLSGCRRGAMFYDNTNIRLLEPTAMVYYNILHFACEHHYSASPGMALCCDIDRVIRTHSIDWEKLIYWAKEDEAGLRIHLALDICNYFLKTPVPLEMFGEQSNNYLKLRNKIIDSKNGYMISQDGKFNRLYAELVSDDKPLLVSAIRRLWRR